jgi:hypothetical protein
MLGRIFVGARYPRPFLERENMPKYLVKDGDKHHDGKIYVPGDMIECTEEVAYQLRLELVKEEKKSKSKES